MVGEDFTVQINVKKTCDETRTIVKLTVDIYTKRYTGDIVSKVTSHSFTDISLEGKKGEREYSNGCNWFGSYRVCPVTAALWDTVIISKNNTFSRCRSDIDVVHF